MPFAPETAAQHQEAANAMLLRVREIAQAVPGFTLLSPERRRRIVLIANTPDDYLQAAGVACDAYEQLSVSSQLTGAECRAVVAFTSGYLSVANEVDILHRGIRDAVALLRYDAILRAHRAYDAAKRLNRPEDRLLLIPHITAMGRALERARSRTPATPEEDEPTTPPAGDKANK